ncbi:organomercurial lyase [Nocardia sp. NPDC101769]|uniref:organomercurial lyase n=1 Tax=Nocardia sp. NPDC101769 TaxID=3364333 RepID=UPI003828639D
MLAATRLQRTRQIDSYCSVRIFPVDSDIAEAVRLDIYRALADTGHLPDLNVIASRHRLSRDDFFGVIEQLGAERHFGLRDGRIVLAHPFATENFGFSVMSQTALWWGGCSWDSFAIAHLVSGAAPMLVATVCPACAKPHAWRVGTDTAPEGNQVAHFLVPMKQVWDDVLHTCGHQRIFCDRGCLIRWLTDHRASEGYAMSVQQLWRLASGWYTGRLDPGYVRRHPSQAAEYFRSVGLTGPFWEA